MSGLLVLNLRHAWPGQKGALSVAKFAMAPSEKVFLQGPSGSGKSTLLGLIAGVNTPQAGEIDVFGNPFHQLGAAARDRVRAELIGVVFQLFNLVPYLSLTDNVLLPCRFSAARAAKAGGSEQARREKAVSLLTRLGLGPETEQGKLAAHLSVGQQQRVAAARALIGSPKLIIADEPTSALDENARDDFIRILLEEAGATGAAVLFVSHDAALGAHFDRAESMESLTKGDAPSQKAAPTATIAAEA